MPELFNRARVSTATTGTGTLALGSAITGYATLAEAGVSDADEVSYVIEDGNDFEIGTGTYTASGTTLSRDTVTLSKISGTAGTSKINLSGNATVFLTARAEDFAGRPTFGIGGATADATNRLSANTPAVLFNRETDDIQVKLNKEAAGDTASFLFQTNFNGFAEIGLTGDDDFHFKVSPDNFSTTFEAIIIDKDDGSVQIPVRIEPSANDGASLGAATLSWSDLFLASGAVVNFANGDVTITHSSNLLTFAGGASLAGVVNFSQTGYTDIAEISTPSNPAANTARLYAFDDTGTTKLAFRDSAGAETVLGEGGGGGITVGTVQATTSGSSITFGSLPSGLNRITVIFDQVGLSGGDDFLIQIGDSGGVETSGYSSTSGTGASSGTSTSGFIALSEGNSGIMTLVRVTGNVWVSSHAMERPGADPVFGGGRKSLSAELDRVVFETTGTDTFNAGQANIFYE